MNPECKAPVSCACGKCCAVSYPEPKPKTWTHNIHERLLKSHAKLKYAAGKTVLEVVIPDTDWVNAPLIVYTDNNFSFLLPVGSDPDRSIDDSFEAFTSTIFNFDWVMIPCLEALSILRP